MPDGGYIPSIGITLDEGDRRYWKINSSNSPSTGNWQHGGLFTLGAPGVSNPLSATLNSLYAGVDSDPCNIGCGSFGPTATEAPGLYLVRGKGSHAVPTAVLNADVLGMISFTGQYDATVGHLSRGAYITGDVTKNWAAGDCAAELNFYTTPQLSATALKRFTIGDDGKLDWLSGNIIYVPLGANIQTYITAATPGDTLVLASGEYIITSTINISKQLNIVGQGRCGFYTIPAAPGSGTVISSVTSLPLGAFQINSSNVRIANLSINMTGAASLGINTAANLSGISINNIDLIITCTGLAQGFVICGSNAVLRDLTFYITSTNSASIGLWLWNDSSVTQNALVDCFNVTGTAQGAATYAYAFCCENINDANTLTLNLSNSVCRAQGGTVEDVAVASISTTTNNSIVNTYLCTLSGLTFDALQNGTNQLNLGGSVLVNNLTSGTVTYRATMAAGTAVLGGTLTLGTGSITDSSGAISFGDENLTTTGWGRLARMGLGTPAHATDILTLLSADIINGGKVLSISHSGNVTGSHTGINYVGSSVCSVEQIGQSIVLNGLSALNTGLKINSSGSATANTAANFTATGGTTATALTLSASGGTNNYCIYGTAGNIYVANYIKFDDTDYNTQIGYQAGLNLVTGARNNVFVGYQAGKGGVITSAADNNTGVGYQSLAAITIGLENTAFGYQSLAALIGATGNTAVGSGALAKITSGVNNVAVGYRTLYTATTGACSVALGYNALTNNTSSYNVAIGYDAGRLISGGGNNATGSSSVFLGYGTIPLANGDANEIVIGYNAIGLGSNTTVIGNSSTTGALVWGNLGVGTAALPAALNKLDLLQTSTTANSVGLNILHSGAITGTGYALYASKTGASTLNVGGYFSASGGTANYALQLSAPAVDTNYFIYIDGNNYWRGDGIFKSIYNYTTTAFYGPSFRGYPGAHDINFMGTLVDAPSVISVKIAAANALTAGTDRWICGFYNDAVTTLKSRINTLGQYETLDTSAAYYVRQAFTSSVALGANRTLTVDLLNLDQNLKFGLNGSVIHSTLTPVGSGGGSTAGTLGEIAWDSNYVYVCNKSGGTGVATWLRGVLAAY